MTTKYLVVVQPNPNNVYYRSPTGLQVFDPPLGWPETNFGAGAIWGAETGELITCPRKASDNNRHMYHLEDGVWVDKGQFPQCWSIFGTSYSNVWACTGDSHRILHFDGTSWVYDTPGALGSSRIDQIHAGSPASNHVFAAAAVRMWRRTGGAYGSGIWVDDYSAMQADTGLGNVNVQGVYAIDGTSYWLITEGQNNFSHWIVRGSAGSYSIISNAISKNYGASENSFRGFDASTMWWIQANGSWGAYHFMLFDGTDIKRQDPLGPIVGPEHDMGAGCSPVLDVDGFYAAGEKRGLSENGISVWTSGGSDWSFDQTITVGLDGGGNTGTSLWYGPDAIPPIIEDNSPTGTITDLTPTISFSTKNVGGFGIDQSTINCTVDGSNAVVGGVIQAGWNGAGSGVTANAFNGYNVVIKPTSILNLGIRTVYTECENTVSQFESLQWTFEIGIVVPDAAVLFTGIGVHPFITAVYNRSPGLLEVQFSEEMEVDTAFLRPSSYVVTPVGDASPLFITEVSPYEADTSRVVLSYTGGGSSYVLATPGLMDIAGNYCDPPDFLFEITAEEVQPQRFFFDTDMGPMALEVEELSERNVEDLAILRAKNEGHLRQFSLIADELERSGIDRDDRKLKLFKG